MRVPGYVVRFGVLVALLAGCVVVLAVVGVPAPGALADLAGGTGVLAPVVAVCASAVLIVGLVPRTLLAAASGLLFGPVAGAAYIIVGAGLGAVAAFGLGRWLGRDFVAMRRRLARLDGWITDGGVFGVVTVRVLPVAPFGMVSYGFGTTGVRLSAFVLGTLLGMVPTSFIYANLGAAVTRPGSPAFWLSIASAVLLWLATSVTILVLRRRRLSRNPGSASES